MCRPIDYGPTGVPCLLNPRNHFVIPGSGRLIVRRDGHSILRSAQVPKPTVLVDTREQQPFTLAANHPNWIGAERRVTLRTGDYSVEGMESLVALERKNLADLVACTAAHRRRFLAGCERLARLPWKAIIIEASYEDIKRGWEDGGIPSEVHPNAVCGTLDAIEAKFGIPIIYTSTHRELSTERAASWLSKHFTYWWLEQNGFGRVLVDSDEL
jgi:ERCC4-type nuclease